MPYQQLAVQLAGLFTCVLTLAIAAGIWLARSITDPMQPLVAAAAQIGEGNYGSDIVVTSTDEIGQLATTLDGRQREIAEREQRNVHQAHHDDLTGLPNRWLANDRLNSAFRRAFSVALFDLSRIKQINDPLGHPVGDVVLQETARRSDTVARLGGDDFLMILEGADRTAAHGILDLRRSSLIAPLELAGMSVSLDFSAGVATYLDHAEDASALMRRAEIAMYDARDSHESLVDYRAGRDDGHLRQLAIVGTLPAALARDELFLYYPPKADLADGAITKAEALVRWIHPDVGFLAPDAFITVIELSGNLSSLTAWIIERAGRQCRDWLGRGLNIRVGANLSALDLLNEGLPVLLDRALRDYELSPRQLGLEITESAVVRDTGSGSVRLRYRARLLDFQTAAGNGV